MKLHKRLARRTFWGLPYFSEELHTQDQGWSVGLRKEYKRFLRSSGPSPQSLEALEREYPIGSLFHPCSGPGYMRLSEVSDDAYYHGFLCTPSFIGPEGWMHHWGGCGYPETDEVMDFLGKYCSRRRVSILEAIHLLNSGDPDWRSLCTSSPSP
jgi:hypothetical protein